MIKVVKERRFNPVCVCARMCVLCLIRNVQLRFPVHVLLAHHRSPTGLHYVMFCLETADPFHHGLLHFIVVSVGD